MKSRVFILCFVLSGLFLSQLANAQQPHGNENTRSTPANAFLDIDMSNFGTAIGLQNTDPTSGGIIDCYNNIGALGGHLQMGILGSGNTFFGSGGESYFSSNANTDMIFRNNTIEAIRIKNDGKVGIGTSTPDFSSKLHVKDGDIIVEDGSMVVKNGDLFLSEPNEEVHLNIFDGDFFINTINSQQAQSDFQLYIKDDNGFVSLNTDNPQSNLHIKQATYDNGNRGIPGIRLEYDDNTNYWTTNIDGANDYNFIYNNTLKGYIHDSDGAYVDMVPFTSGTSSRNSGKVLNKVMELQPSYFNVKSGKNKKVTSLGFVPEEMQAVLPECVVEKEGQKGIAYSYVTTVAIKAIQELKTELDEKDYQIENLSEELSDVKTELAELKALVQSLANHTNSSNLEIANPTQNIQVTSAYLEQNNPNPFENQTSIAYFVPENASQAQLQITDLNGRILKIETLMAKGHGTVVLDMSTLSKGTYGYTLVVDGEVVSSKQMVK